jgi:hypothetical protein
MEVGQKVVFVREAKGAEVGKHGTVIGVSDNLVTVECRFLLISTSFGEIAVQTQRPEDQVEEPPKTY